MDHPKPVPYNELVIGELYEVHFKLGTLVNLTVALPYRGVDEKLRMMFGDGPNGIFIAASMQPSIYRFSDFL